jgi:cytochrome c
MSRFISLAFTMALALNASAKDAYPGVGRPATPAEIAAWDIDVRADFKGLPGGAGSAKEGEKIWEAQCASCHGTFGESNAVFPPIAGGVTDQDIQIGRAAALARPGEQRTTLMKLSQLSTLWDYISRTMPWNAPKTLSANEVYAVTAYILSFDKIVPEDFVLSDRNIGETQKRLPNRNGMTRAHGLWNVKGRPDVNSRACMMDCPVEGKVVSRLPDHALGSHGDLAEQTRRIGPVRGTALAAGFAPKGAALALAEREGVARALAGSAGCLACHGAAARIAGPSLAEIAARYRSDEGVEARLMEKVRSGGQGAWGAVPMPPQPGLQDGELRAVVRWILTGVQ